MTKKAIICCLPSDLSGVPLYTIQVARILRNSGLDVSILTKERGAAFSEDRLGDGINILTCETLENKYSFVEVLKCVSLLKKVIRTESPDVLHLNGSLFGLAGRLLPLGELKCRIYTYHGIPFDKGVPFIRRALLFFPEFFLLNTSRTRNVVISKKNQRLIDRMTVFSGETWYIPNSISTENFSEDYSQSDIDGARVLNVAVFRPQKNHEFLFRSFSLLSEAYTLTLVGRGTDNMDCRNMAAKYLSSEQLERVEFLGERDDLGLLYRSHSIFVLSSRYEGLPLAALEAMYCDLPIVMTRVSGSEEICADGVGTVLNETKNPFELAKAIQTTYQEISGGRRESNIGPKFFARHFSEEAFERRIHRLYEIDAVR